MDAELVARVRQRAGNRCEYCRLHQDHCVLRFHIEHIVPRKHGGDTVAGNLALACNQCNLHKGPNLTGIDPESKKTVPLFHPRRQKWARHFRVEGTLIVGRTAVARATVRVLDMNSDHQMQLREELQTLGQLDWS
jgi:hypothetical protein